MLAFNRRLTLANAVIDHTRHVCALFSSDEEEYNVMLPFIREGFDLGQKAVHIVDSSHQAEHLRRLEQAGIDTQAAQTAGQLEIRASEDHYPAVEFDYRVLLGLMEDALRTTRNQGYPLARIMGHAERALEHREAARAFLEYEAHLNELLADYDDPVICTYAVSKLGSGAVIDVLRTHPAVIIGGTLQQNPFYVPPGQFLEELRAVEAQRLPIEAT